MKKLAIWFASIALSASAAFAAELDWTFSFAPDNIALAPRGEYTVVSLADGSDPRDAIGAPAIPARFANILLPDGATDVSVSAVGDLVPLASDVTPWPVQRVAPKSKPQPPFTAPDPAAYASADPWPAAAATFEGVHEMQGSTFVSVRVNPLVYVAAEKALYYRPSVAVTVTYTPAASAAPRAARSVSQNALATEMVNALVVNPEAADAPAARARRAAARASAVDYLIITSSGLSSAFQNLADYRATAAGGSFKTLVVTTNDIASSYSGDDIQMKIRNCISNYVKNSGTTYVVIGGDDKIVPDRDCYGNVDNETYEWHMPTDLYYSDLTGTWKASGNTNFGVVAASVDMSPDVIVGRIPVRTAAQLNGYLAKVQAFEADTTHTRNSIIMGGPAAWCRYYGSKRPSDNVSLDGHAAFRSTSPAHTYVSDSEMWLRRLYRDGIYTNWNRAESASTRTVNIACDSITSWDTSSCGDKELSASNLKTWLNNGYTHLMFSGHGYPQGWGMEGSANYSTTQASAQTGLVAFVYTDACLTGAFDEDGVKSSGITVDVGTSDQYTYTSEPCLGEAYIRNTSGGALVHMGCARYGWGTPDASSGTSAEDSDGYYTNYTATATSDGGPSTIYAYKFYKRLYESAAVSSNRTLGAAFAMSKADMISQCSSDGCERWIQFGLNYLGDPAIALYPRAIEETAPAFSSATASAAAVVGEELLFDFEDLLSAGYPDPTFSITSTAPASTYEVADGLISFTPAAAGTYTFTCTAANDIGSATCTLTVTATLPPPDAPDVPSTPPAADTTSFTATWSAVADAASYKLYVQQKVEPAATSARAASTLLSEDFTGFASSSYSTTEASQTVDSGTWTYVNVIMTPGGSANGTGSQGYAQLKASSGYLYLPTLENPSALSVTARASSGTLTLEQQISGTWTSIATWDLAATGTEYTHTFTTATSATALRFAAASKATYIHDVTVTGASETWVDVPGYSPISVSGTSQLVSGLTAGTEYRYAVSAVNSEGTESEPSAYVAVTTAEGASAPVISVPQASYDVTLGDGNDVSFTVTASGSPVPTLALASATAAAADYDFDPSDGYFVFTPSATGAFTFTFTASNSEGTDTATVTVTVSAAPVTVPELLVGDETATTAYATWTACDGVTSYTLQLASDDQFTAGCSGGSVTLFSNDGTDPSTAPDGWTYNLKSTSGSYLQLMSGNYVVTEAFDASACVDLTLSLYMRTYNGTTYPSVTVQYSTDDGATWSDSLGTLSAASSTMAQRTLDVSAAAGASSVRLRIASTSSSTSTGVGIKTIVLTGTESSGTGSLISSATVAGTEYTFTGLTPYTVYYARVKGDGDWSNVEEFLTEEEVVTDTAPAWSATFPATATVAVGDFYELANVSSYVSGSPAPTITLDAPAGVEAELADGTFTFAAEASGSYTFTFTAANGISPDATATLVVTAVGQAPVLTASQGTAVAATVGDTVEFTVTATGNPAPTVAMAATEYDAIFENGEFAFAPDAVGTYAFTFTAANSEGTDTLTVTVTVSAAPVTVPELTVTDVTDTTALATWTACDGVTTYTLQLSTNDFTAASGASRSATPILSEDFSGFTGSGTTDISTTLDSYTATAGWTGSKVYCNSGEAKIGASSGQPWIMTPAMTASGTLRVVWTARRYGSSDHDTLLLGVSENGTDFTDETITLADEMTTYTNEFALAGSTAYVRWMGSGSSKARFYLDDVAITNPGGGDAPADDGIQEFTVTGTSHEFTDLTPFTVYYARVKGDSYWSNTEEFLTEEGSSPEPSSDFEQWLADHDAAGAAADDIAGDDVHTFWDYYLADIDPYSSTFLAIEIADPAAGTFTIPAASANRIYYLLWTTDLTQDMTEQSLGAGDPSAAIPFPATGDWYGGLKVTLEEP